MKTTHAVTGAFGYTGRYLARHLLAQGKTVITLTGNPDRPNPFGDQVRPFPFSFDDPGALARSLEGVRTLYNTTDLSQAAALLKQLKVDFVYVGQLERYYYDPNGLAKFDRPDGPWALVYQNLGVNIYQAR